MIKRTREYSRITWMHPEVIRNFPEMSAMDTVLKNVLNSDEHSDSDEFGNETIRVLMIWT